MDQKLAEIKEAFVQSFGTTPMVIKAPGRINIIGEHTDYNDGLVLPAAIDQAVYIFIQKGRNGACHLHALDLNETFTFDIQNRLKPAKMGWANYFLGVACGLMELGYKLGGIDVMFTSNIPIGAGLSSSAALESGFGFALSSLFELEVDLKTLAQTGQKAEHEFAGVQCGIMDQYASCMGKQSHAIRLDCRSLTHEYIRVALENHEFMLFDSCVKHNLVESEYNQRRQQCEAGLRAIQEINPEAKSLRDATIEDLEQARPGMDTVVYRRCHFVIREIQRVDLACEALRKVDVRQLGQLMTQTHNGLRDDYEVSCKELDILIDIAGRCAGFLGGRMMGGGFGGCTINLVEKSQAEEIIREVTTAYAKKTGIETKVYRVSLADGVKALKQ